MNGPSNPGRSPSTGRSACDVRRDCVPPARRRRRDSGSPDVLGVTGRRRRRPVPAGSGPGERGPESVPTRSGATPGRSRPVPVGSGPGERGPAAAPARSGAAPGPAAALAWPVQVLQLPGFGCGLASAAEARVAGGTSWALAPAAVLEVCGWAGFGGGSVARHHRDVPSPVLDCLLGARLVAPLAFRDLQHVVAQALAPAWRPGRTLGLLTRSAMARPSTVMPWACAARRSIAVAACPIFPDSILRAGIASRRRSCRSERFRRPARIDRRMSSQATLSGSVFAFRWSGV